jgi:5'-nucleotidase
LNILITNDDGVDSPSLPLLMEKLIKSGHKVLALVPDRERSGSSHSITLTRPLRLQKVSKSILSIDGTPTDCVNIVMLGGLKFPRPDLVLSGINLGANMSEDVYYSGTVAGAREAALFGVPAIAVSLCWFQKPDFTFAASFTADFISLNKFGKNTLLNINIPGLPKERIKGIKVTRLGNRKYKDVLVKRRDPWGEPYFWIHGKGISISKEKGTDFLETRRGYISITPLALDLTAHSELESIPKKFRLEADYG